VLLGAFARLRVAEVSGLRVLDADFTRGDVHSRQQWGGKPLKTAARDTPIPVPRWPGAATRVLGAAIRRRHGREDGFCKPCAMWVIRNAVAGARERVDAQPERFSFHDLRHYFASLLIASGADIKTVQAR
jgi:integrase